MPRRWLQRHQPPPCGGCSLKAGLGAGLALTVVALLGEQAELAMLIAPFGASCVLLFAMPDSPLSQPANVIGGHMLATGIALGVDALLPDGLPATVLAVGLAIVAMSTLRLTHPPAGADPLVVMAIHPGADFLVMPVLLGATALVATAAIIHRIPPVRRYPLPPPEPVAARDG